uniref:XPG N-terminal domain-containing protein n=1 Tax=Rhodnius prolixus TaxID=13249 RepID=T1ICF5_RHOPR
MGVHGLWKLIDNAGKPIPIETLESKVLAVDVSIWLYQLVKGFQERAGRTVNNPFLLGLFHRICKLLFYRIKPIFVFDGGVPVLKKKTIAARHRNRSRANEISEKLKKNILENLAKQHALGRVLGQENIEIPKMLLPKQDNMFHLPPLPLDDKNSFKSESLISEEDSDSSEEYMRYKYSKGDLQSIDIKSEEFLTLPADIRHDILSELKETRKENSWANVHLMPESSSDFSNFQMGRLLKRRAIQVGLEKAEGEMGTRGFTISDIQDILKEQGVDVGQRIAADNVTRFLYASIFKKSLSLTLYLTNREKHRNLIFRIGAIVIMWNDRRVKGQRGMEEQLTITFRESLSYSFSKTVLKNMLSEEGSSSSEEDYFEIPHEQDLSQQEILNLIKNENAKNVGSTKIYDINLPSTSKFYQEHDIQKKNVDTDEVKKNEIMKTAIQDQVVEHGNKLNEDNEKLKLDHEKLPRVNRCNKTTISQKGNIRSNNNLLLREQRGDNKLAEFNDAIKEVKIIENKNSSVLPDNKNKPSIIEETYCNNSLEKNFDQGNCKNFNLKDKSDDLISKKVLEREISSEREGPVTSPNISQDSSESDDDFVEVSMNTTNDESIAILSKNENTSISPTATLEIEFNSKGQDGKHVFAEIVNSSIEDKCSILSPVAPECDSVEPFVRENIQFKSNISKVVPPHDLNSPIKLNNAVIKREHKNINDQHDEDKPDIKALEETSNKENETDECITSAEQNKEIKNANKEEFHIRPKQLNVEEIINMKTNLEKESAVLVEETSREERVAASISEQITVEAQELLRLFGLPYIVAPMEAEAQCAYLDITGQTSGTITDDSDIWLFGANNVYKNFFDQKKFVKQFKALDIERIYHMDREDLIMLAMLTGSDYTTGLPGIGPVNALEITARFRPREEHASPDQRLARFVQAYKTQMLDEQLAKKLKNLDFLEGFPSKEVVRAYISPTIDDSKEPFSWTQPNLDKLRQYTEDKFGWNRSDTDRVLLPILNKLKQNQTQRTMHNYFEWAFDNIESKMSRRVEKAVNILGGK